MNTKVLQIKRNVYWTGSFCEVFYEKIDLDLKYQQTFVQFLFIPTESVTGPIFAHCPYLDIFCSTTHHCILLWSVHWTLDKVRTSLPSYSVYSDFCIVWNNSTNISLNFLLIEIELSRCWAQEAADLFSIIFVYFNSGTDTQFSLWHYFLISIILEIFLKK